MIHIRLLGGFHVDVDGHSADSILSKSPKGILLMQYLMLHQGEQMFYDSTEAILDYYRLVRGRYELFTYMKSRILGTRLSEFTAEGLIKNDGEPVRLNLECVRPTMEDLMYYIKQGIITKGMV